MPRRKRRTRRRNETLVRFVAINTVSAGTSIGAAQERGAEPRLSSTARIELTGTMDEPIRDTRDIEIVLYAADDPKPGRDPTPWIGLVHGIRPVMHAAIFMPHRDFDRVWFLALSGLLRHAHLFQLSQSFDREGDRLSHPGLVDALLDRGDGRRIGLIAGCASVSDSSRGCSCIAPWSLW